MNRGFYASYNTNTNNNMNAASTAAVAASSTRVSPTTVITAPVFGKINNRGMTAKNRNRLQSRLNRIATLGVPNSPMNLFARPTGNRSYKNYNKAMGRLQNVLSEDQKKLIHLLEVLKIQRDSYDNYMNRDFTKQIVADIYILQDKLGLPRKLLGGKKRRSTRRRSTRRRSTRRN